MGICKAGGYHLREEINEYRRGERRPRELDGNKSSVEAAKV